MYLGNLSGSVKKTEKNYAKAAAKEIKHDTKIAAKLAKVGADSAKGQKILAKEAKHDAKVIATADKRIAVIQQKGGTLPVNVALSTATAYNPLPTAEAPTVPAIITPPAPVSAAPVTVAPVAAVAPPAPSVAPPPAAESFAQPLAPAPTMFGPTSLGPTPMPDTTAPAAPAEESKTPLILGALGLGVVALMFLGKKKGR